ncbi:alpha/beta fold hydrolase [Staphylococcus sp. SQ8-PEA]|uniref:Alpha/beta fold hydrolase n=1 Tax=Staphylococcus marylandisciuri TaxID=2981529 RepID=A0ABT2QSL5_9STAP|nr:alpha/beta fold hydrolase [Staphylococcus marylandisciuri]MCU5746984.1 alpha/beta fold hydrolase [Staphylococcus marylandisciuri]
MINVKSPNPIYLENDNSDSAVLLLHSFTGTVRDVKLLATKLHKAGYTCLVPSYRGHGLLLPDLIAYDTDDWWEDVEKAYHFLRNKGYQRIHVMGVSLGGLLSLRLAENHQVDSVVVMSTPNSKDHAGLKRRLAHYGQRMGELVGLESNVIDQQLSEIEMYEESLDLFQDMIETIMSHLNQIQAPIAVKYGERDEASYERSAQFIYDHVPHENKTLQSYAEAGHLMTQGKAHREVEDNILAFLNSIHD